MLCDCYPWQSEQSVIVWCFWFCSFSSVKNELLPSHPLEVSEKNVSNIWKSQENLIYLDWNSSPDCECSLVLLGHVTIKKGKTNVGVILVVYVVCSSLWTRTRWTSPRWGISRVFMLLSNCRWNTGQPDRWESRCQTPSFFLKYIFQYFVITPDVPLSSRSSVCHFCRAQIWLWIRFGATMRLLASRTSSMVRASSLQH